MAKKPKKQAPKRRAAVRPTTVDVKALKAPALSTGQALQVLKAHVLALKNTLALGSKSDTDNIGKSLDEVLGKIASIPVQ